jgi:CelD/BcsL family acetyltransferase involved in cellulose biosynthesis
MIVRAFDFAKNQSELQRCWNEVLSSLTTGVSGPDATCSFEWCETVWNVLREDRAARVFVAFEGSKAVALLPVVLQPPRPGVFAPRILVPLNELYCSRSRLLLSPGHESALIELLSHAAEEMPRWDIFLATLLDDGVTRDVLRRADVAAEYALEVLGESQSPYFALAISWEAQLAALAKKFRWTIRSSLAGLEKLGTLRYAEILRPAQVADFLTAMMVVERNSWKEQSGTSISVNEAQQSFFTRYAEAAARSGTLSAHLLSLNEVPIAYIFGVRDGNVFLDLKESFSSEYSKHSPGHVLKRYTLDRLIANGIEWYDFMGACEPYKMRWTSTTYTRSTFALYRRDLRGGFQLFKTRLARLRRSTASKQGVEASDPAAD